MREFKFRAWRGKVRGLEYPNECNFDGFVFNDTKDLIGLGGVKDSCDAHLENCDELVLMEYSGVNDINKKEIYEGDIIKITDVNRNKIWISDVRFIDGEFICQDFDYLESDFYSIPLSAFKTDKSHKGTFICEVIGNIFENIHLLDLRDNLKDWLKSLKKIK